MKTFVRVILRIWGRGLILAPSRRGLGQRMDPEGRVVRSAKSYTSSKVNIGCPPLALTPTTSREGHSAVTPTTSPSQQHDGQTHKRLERLITGSGEVAAVEVAGR